MGKKNTTNQKEAIPNPCSLCKSLVSEITRNGFKPYCKKGKYRFKERTTVDYINDKDINSKGCEKWMSYK